MDVGVNEDSHEPSTVLFAVSRRHTSQRPGRPRCTRRGRRVSRPRLALSAQRRSSGAGTVRRVQPCQRRNRSSQGAAVARYTMGTAPTLALCLCHAPAASRGQCRLRSSSGKGHGGGREKAAGPPAASSGRSELRSARRRSRRRTVLPIWARGHSLCGGHALRPISLHDVEGCGLPHCDHNGSGPRSPGRALPGRRLGRRFSWYRSGLWSPLGLRRPGAARTTFS